MNTLTFKGEEIEVRGLFPRLGQQAPNFTLVDNSLQVISRVDLLGKKVVLNIFPSVDTPVCEVQLKTFNQKLAERDDVYLVFASLDLPFAYSRFCAAEGISNVITASDYRHASLAANYGVQMTSGPLAGLYARAVIVLNEDHQILHAEIVNEVTNEPDYDAAITALSIS